MYFFKVYTPHYHIKIKIKIKQKEKEVLEEVKLIFQPRKYIYIINRIYFECNMNK